jgi:hypothetical protein
MKNLFAIVLLVAAFAVTGCGEKKAATKPTATPDGGTTPPAAAPAEGTGEKK